MTDRPRLHRDARAGVERVVVWLVALAVVAGVGGAVGVSGPEIRREVPDTEFAITFDEETRTVVVEHVGGDAITDRTTRRLSVVVRDASTGRTANATWVSDTPGPTTRGQGYPVERGDAFAVDDPAVDANDDEDYFDADAIVGFHLAANDSVRVVWEGSRFGGPPRIATLANATLG